METRARKTEKKRVRVGEQEALPAVHPEQVQAPVVVGRQGLAERDGAAEQIERPLRAAHEHPTNLSPSVHRFTLRMGAPARPRGDRPFLAARGRQICCERRDRLRPALGFASAQAANSSLELEFAPEPSHVGGRLAAAAGSLAAVLELADQADDLGATRARHGFAGRAAGEQRMGLVEPPVHPVGHEIAEEPALPVVERRREGRQWVTRLRVALSALRPRM